MDVMWHCMNDNILSYSKRAETLHTGACFLEFSSSNIQPFFPKRYGDIKNQFNVA